jgi:hypothetical protein
MNEKEQDFAEGYDFALTIMRARGIEPYATLQEEVDYLTSIITKELSLMPSPEECTNEFTKVAYRQMFSQVHRNQIDAENREKAKIILKDIMET